MKEKSNEIPEDILQRLQDDFITKSEYKKALILINHIRQDNLNVGWIQLSRAILLISNGDIHTMNEIIESNYYGDPRDVIMQMMELPENTNRYGITPFETRK